MSKAVFVVCLLIAQCLVAGCEGQADPRPPFPPMDVCGNGRPAEVFFETGQADLSAATVGMLDSLVRTWRVGGGRFAVDGHTDAAGTASANRVLALVRANKVKAYLMNAGVPAESIQVRGYGHQRPLVQVSTAEPQNRRVEIFFTANRDCFKELREPFDKWYARNCRPSARPGRSDDCKSVEESFPQ